MKYWTMRAVIGLALMSQTIQFHAVAHAQADNNAKSKSREDLAWEAFAGMIKGLWKHTEEDGLAHGERLFRLYGEEAAKFKQAKIVLADLQRRKEQGKFGKTLGAKEPEGFDAWPIAKRIEYWIDSLEDIDASQNGFPGGVDLASDRRVKALIDLGDAAVPRLIDVLEKDKRLTRSVHMWRPWARNWTVLNVSETRTDGSSTAQLGFTPSVPCRPTNSTKYGH